jgi:hypothetical protein
MFQPLENSQVTLDYDDPGFEVRDDSHDDEAYERWRDEQEGSDAYPA